MFLLDHFQNYWNLDLGCKHDKDEIAFRGGNVIGNLKQAHMERKVRQIVFFAMNPAFVPKFWRILPPVTVKTQYPVNVSRIPHFNLVKSRIAGKNPSGP